MTSNQLVPSLDPVALLGKLDGHHFIGGQLARSLSNGTFDVVNPASGKVIAQAANGDTADVDRAVASAKAAQKGWAALNARERGKLVSECGRRLTDHVEELARLMVLETGKAIRTECRVECGVLADVFTFYGGLAPELKGESVPFSNQSLSVTIREPIGVVGAIIPWNVPLLLMALKVAPALVAGNGVVVKSAEEAPFSAMRVAQILGEVLPPGIFNILSGYGPECGAPLVAHKDVGKVTFTGSVETGRIVYRTAADKLIPVTLELGGKSPMIVLEDADLDKAVEGAVVGMRFTRQGQSCTAASRIFVHEKLHDAFVDKLKAKVDAMRIGDPMKDETDIGSIISPDQFSKVKKYIDLGTDTPGAVAHPVGQLIEDETRDGLFVQPIIFTGVPNDATICREEIFGPVTCIIKWADYDDVIAQANDTDYGLAASVWTNDMKKALDATRRLEAGLVQVNQNLVVQPNISYGGVKSSGLGKEASLEAMLEHFTHKKTMMFNMT
jgi:aldehyde dehydrogenase (NAD+)